MRIIAVLAAIFLMAGAAVSAPVDGAMREERPPRTIVSDELRQSINLLPGELVKVHSIQGDVTIDTFDGSVAEIVITRSGPTAAALQARRIEIRKESRVLHISGKSRSAQAASAGEADLRHEVRLRLPRRAAVRVESVSGRVRVGDLDGTLSVEGVGGELTMGRISGAVTLRTIAGGASIEEAGGAADVSGVGRGLAVAKALGALDISTVTGGVRIGEARGNLAIRGSGGPVVIRQALGPVTLLNVSGDTNAVLGGHAPQPIRVDSVGGSVDLLFSSEVNADLVADNIGGKIGVWLSSVRIERRGRLSLEATIGSGGPRIAVHTVAGNLNLLRQN
jgi:hypothetical protein